MKTGKTFVEKVLDASAGNIVFCEPDIILSHDNSARVRKLFENMGGINVLHPEKLVVVLDRKLIGTTDELIRDYNSIHHFMEEQKVENFFDCDRGICHEVLAEFLKQGMFVTGSDSHTCTAGAFNCLATGLNKTETATLWKTGKMWFRVPETIKITLRNKLSEGVYAKDLALWIAGMLRDEHVAYRALEFHGDGVHSLSIADRMTVANMSAEMGIKNAVFPPDDTLADYFKDYAIQGVWADENAVYCQEFDVDLAGVIPLVMSAFPENEVKGIGEWGNLAFQQGLIGACASGRLEDLRVAARILKDKKIAPGFQLSIVPASRAIYLKAIEEGLIDIMVKAGASILGASCGPCLGSSHMILADTKRFISTTNSNSMRRMSAVGVEKFVASPATVAMTAINGVLSSEKEYDDMFPYEAISNIAGMLDEYDNRLDGKIWNYADIDNISCEQLFAERWTYHISIENTEAMLPHLLAGLDSRFAKQVNSGDILLAGEDFGKGKLIKHAAVGLMKVGVEAVIVKSVSRDFFRMAANHGLLLLIAPLVVENYHPGDTIKICLEKNTILLNEQEYKLPKIHPDFLQMIKNAKGVNG